VVSALVAPVVIGNIAVRIQVCTGCVDHLELAGACQVGAYYFRYRLALGIAGKISDGNGVLCGANTGNIDAQLGLRGPGRENASCGQQQAAGHCPPAAAWRRFDRGDDCHNWYLLSRTSDSLPRSPKDTCLTAVWGRASKTAAPCVRRCQSPKCPMSA